MGQKASGTYELKKQSQQGTSLDQKPRDNQFRRIVDIVVFFAVEYRFFILAFVSVAVTVFSFALTFHRIRGWMDPDEYSKQNNPVLVHSTTTVTVPSPTPSPTPTPTSTPTPTPTPTPDPTLRQGDENERVQELQERLMKLNYMDLDEATQYYGTMTKYAVELFQRQHDLTMDGVAGPKTLDLIFSSDAKKYTLLEGTSGDDVDSLQATTLRPWIFEVGYGLLWFSNRRGGEGFSETKRIDC